ncbi:White-opaque regulator 3 [Candida viswanathii]|uniref:White-opaque regulator 3 n=1 Tax=Candida viswanathii TaxID=5486 RepID=A0A367YA98_9ASCO|nr:White-opaque regulator 3 [Candida viswanathii]
MDQPYLEHQLDQNVSNNNTNPGHQDNSHASYQPQQQHQPQPQQSQQPTPQQLQFHSPLQTQISQQPVYGNPTDARYQQYQQVQPRGSSQQPLHPPPPPTYIPMPSSNYISNQPYGQYAIQQQPRQMYDAAYSEQQPNPLSYNNNDRNLVAPIPPLHVQQQLVTKHETSPINNSPVAVKQEPPHQHPSSATSSNSSHSHPSTVYANEDHQMVRSNCTRCKKEFDQPVIIPKVNDSAGGQKLLAEPKIFKLCQHCRDLQRQRSRRWQKKTKDKQGVCRRCGSEIPIEERKFVLCPNCRQNLRTRKANRAAQGKCVHCSGPLDTSILVKDENGNVVSEPSVNGDSDSEDKKGTRGSNNYKVCQRCRENDKIRRTNLEKMGNCNRCAKALDPSDHGRNKVCLSCRSKKKKSTPTLKPTSPIQSLYGMQPPGHLHQGLPPHHMIQPQPMHQQGGEQMNMLGNSQQHSGSTTTNNTTPNLGPEQHQQYSTVPLHQHHYGQAYAPMPPQYGAPIHGHPQQQPPPLQMNQYQGLQQYSHSQILPPPPPPHQQQKQQQPSQVQSNHHQDFQNNYPGVN